MPVDGLTDEVLYALLGQGGVLYIATQIVKFALIIAQRAFPNLKPAEGFMGWANLVLALILFGGFSLANQLLADFDAASNVERLTLLGGSLLTLVMSIAGSHGYYRGFRAVGTPVLGQRISE